MSDDRAREVRALIRANLPKTPDDTSLRAAIARQEAAMLANREPYSAFLEETGGVSTGPSTAVTFAPVALGLGAFAAIVLTDGTEDLSWVRFLIAALVFFAVTGVSAFAVRHWYGD